MFRIFIFCTTLLIYQVAGLSFDYLQEYSIGKNGIEQTSSRIKGVIVFKPVLSGDEIEWAISLKNFNITFNDSNPNVLNISCTTFVSNPVLQTLLLDDEDPTKNTCPDELKQLISVTLLFLKKESIGIYSNASRSDNKFQTRENEFEISSCGDPVTDLQLVNTNCIIQTSLTTRNCSSTTTDTQQSDGVTVQTLFKYFKLNFTIEAEFERCDVTVTALKSLTTDRFFIKNQGVSDDHYARIREKYTLIDDVEDDLQFREIELNMDGTKAQKKKKQLPWRKNPGTDWFEMASLLNSVYAPTVVYETLSDWVFS